MEEVMIDAVIKQMLKKLSLDGEKFKRNNNKIDQSFSNSFI